MVTINSTGTNSITIDYAANAISGTLSVTASNACGTSTASQQTIQISYPKTADAGPDQVVCASSPIITLNGSYLPFTAPAPEASWSASGTGSFNDNTLWNAIYTPSAADISFGSVALTLSITPGSCPVTSDAMIITITPIATISAGVSQTVCINTPLTPDITYTTTGATGAAFTGLPDGVIGSWAGNIVTIAGSPSVSGTFNYTVTLTGCCGIVTATGTIDVIPLPVSSPMQHN